MRVTISTAVVQSLSCVPPFATPQTAAHQASLSFTLSLSLLTLMSIEFVMPSNRLILCYPLLIYLALVKEADVRVIGQLGV